MEYLLVVGFSLLIIVPLILILNTSYQQQAEDVHLEQLSSIAKELAYQADKLSFQGAPAQTTLQATFPQHVEEAIIEDHAIIFTLEDTEITILSETHAQLKGTLKKYPGLHTITLRVEDYGTLDDSDDEVIITDT